MTEKFEKVTAGGLYRQIFRPCRELTRSDERIRSLAAGKKKRKWKVSICICLFAWHSVDSCSVMLHGSVRTFFCYSGWIGFGSRSHPMHLERFGSCSFCFARSSFKNLPIRWVIFAVATRDIAVQNYEHIRRQDARRSRRVQKRRRLNAMLPFVATERIWVESFATRIVQPVISWSNRPDRA